MKALILRFDAPMVSFGGVTVDQHGFTDSYPGQAMLTGLIANALGWHQVISTARESTGRLDYAYAGTWSLSFRNYTPLWT